jgi:hypothetical protein
MRVLRTSQYQCVTRLHVAPRYMNTRVHSYGYWSRPGNVQDTEGLCGWYNAVHYDDNRLSKKAGGERLPARLSR